MFLRLENLYKIFPARGGSSEVTAVSDVNVIIEEGQFVTLLGPSGCGKTTTLRLIAGFEFPTQGRIVLDEREINELPPNLRDMSMVFQSYAIFPHLNVFENIAYGLKIRRLSRNEIKQKVAHVLELTELNGLENRAPNQLSGGQQQRVALARALVMEPKVLLLDEPLSNLDAKLRDQMRTEIREIQQRLGITSVYVTHDQIEAMSLSDRIVVMNAGQVEQIGSPAEIYRKPKSAFVANFIGRTNFVPATAVETKADQLTLRALAGVLTVPQPDEPRRTDEAVTLVIRPDAVRLRDQAAQFSGIVRRSTYLGSQVEYDVEVAGQALIAIESDPRHVVVYEPGAQVGVDFLAETIYVLPGHQSIDL